MGRGRGPLSFGKGLKGGKKKDDEGLACWEIGAARREGRSKGKGIKEGAART